METKVDDVIVVRKWHWASMFSSQINPYTIILVEVLKLTLHPSLLLLWSAKDLNV